MEKGLVLLSGGQDSTTCLYWALNKFNYVESVGFYYGQRHSGELAQAAKIAEMCGIKHTVKYMANVLTVDKESFYRITWGRNILFLTVAASLAKHLNINNLIMGASQADQDEYPDCRPEFLSVMEAALSSGLGFNINIHTPLIKSNKAETWKMAKDLNCLDVIINHTLTDYNGNTDMNEWGMGKLDNHASEERAKGFYEAKKLNWI